MVFHQAYGLNLLMRGLLQKWVEYIFGNGMLGMAKNILDINPSTGSFSTVWKVFAGLYENVCVPLGMGIVLIYFLANLMERSMQQQQMDVEHVIKMLLKLVVGLYFIEHGLELMTSIYSMGLSFLNEIVGKKSVGEYTAGDTIAHEAWKSLSGEEWEGKWSFIQNISKGLPLLLQLMLPYILSWLIQLVVCAVCFFRLIEFYIITCMAPIALSDFFTEGLHGNGWRFLKNYMAIALQMGVILLAIVAFNGIIVGFLPKTGLADVVVPIVGLGKAAYVIIMYIACGAACCAILLKSRTLAKEIVGAH